MKLQRWNAGGPDGVGIEQDDDGEWYAAADVDALLARIRAAVESERASLDHDLSDRATACAATGQPMPPGERTGYTVVCWMEEHGVWPPCGVTCHSANPVGRARIMAVVDRHWAGGE